MNYYVVHGKNLSNATNEAALGSPGGHLIESGHFKVFHCAIKNLKNLSNFENLSREFPEFESDLKFWPGPSQLTLENL